MDAKTAQMAIQFLQRAQLSGAEVPTFLAVVAALGVIASPAPDATTEPTPQ